MTTIIKTRLEALPTIRLDKGAHDDFTEGHCAMEVVAWLAGLGHTDAPECASPVLTSFTISLNDQWDEAQRQKLVPFLPRMVGTRGDGKDEQRSYLALDWLIRTYTPALLDLAGLTAEAKELRGLQPIVDLVSAEAAGPVVRAAHEKARAALEAAGEASSEAAGDAAAAAAWAAAGDAAWVAGDIAWVAGDVTWAAGAVAWAAGAAARDAARDALKPTVETLQASALDLLDRMIDPT